MEEELVVKAPVTRLRRRLSIESDESINSPSAPSTPSKKRGRLAAKPQLELIDEDVTDTAPKRNTRKSVARDIEPAEDKVLTPSRRSTRIRSNTSLLVDTPQVSDSPRAKRAARRNSQLGSDNETPSAPVAQTRRTRKGSTTSIDIKGSDNETPVTPARQPRKTKRNSSTSVDSNAEVEPKDSVVTNIVNSIKNTLEEKTYETENKTQDETSPTTRKSPRIAKKKTNEDKTSDKDLIKSDVVSNENLSQASKEEEFNNVMPTKTDNNSNDEDPGSLNKSESSLINAMNLQLKKPLVVLHRSMGNVEEKTNNGKRKRTKSWTTLTGTIYEQNLDITGSGDVNDNPKNNEAKEFQMSVNRSLNKSKNDDECKSESEAKTDAVILQGTPSKNLHSILVLTDDSDSNSGKLVMNLPPYEDQCVPVVENFNNAPRDEVEPMDIDETIPDNVTISDFIDKNNLSKEEATVQHPKTISMSKNESINESPKKSRNSVSICIPFESNKENESLNRRRTSSVSIQVEASTSVDEVDSSRTTSNKSKNKISVSHSESTSYEVNSSVKENAIRSNNFNTNFEIDNNNSGNVDKPIDSNNKSRKSQSKDESQIRQSFNQDENVDEKANTSMRLSSSFRTDSQNLEKTSNASKSTLVLSQLKDTSTNETKNVSKDLHDTSNEPLIIPEAKKDKKLDNSQNYLTSTPLQQKPLQKLVMQINSSVISPDINKSEDKKSKENISDDVDCLENEEEETVPKLNSEMIDDEASEASENYESGDSRDEEERRYEEEHEIEAKGETLETDEEFSIDSDYEKDSFIVSSEAEDDELLSGSENDLTLSDNELKMTAKSKEKFNERKRKEQKKASKEMYEARHKLDISSDATKSAEKSKTKKSKRQRLESSQSNSEDEKPVKKNRLRIDSSQDESIAQDIDESVGYRKKKKSKRLSESINEELEQNEKEITINANESVHTDPLAEAIKLEPKTPQKDFNISTVPIVENVEEIQVENVQENGSIIKSNETSDPLQDTMAEDDSLSENEQIMDNYDSILKNLNNQDETRKLKTLDTSLNIKKKKAKSKNPIIDQLNITHTKTAQIKNNSQNQSKVHKIDNEGSEASDSIDMQLLFPEDSNDSESGTIKQDKTDINIPLKRTEATTHIPETFDQQSDTEVIMFIDTKGTLEMNGSESNKKSFNLSQNVEQDNAYENVEGVDSDVKSDKKKKKKNKNKNSASQQDTEKDELSETVMSEKFGNISQLSQCQEAVDSEVRSDKKKKKKNKNKNSASQQDLETDELSETVMSDKLENIAHLYQSQEEIKSDKKNKKEKNKNKNNSLVVNQQDVETDELSKTIESEKTSEVITGVDSEVRSDKKKKKKNKNKNSASQQDLETDELSETLMSDKLENIAHLYQSQEEVKNDKKNKKEKNKNKTKSLIVNQQDMETDELSKTIEAEKTSEVITDSTNIVDTNSAKKIKKKTKNQSLTEHNMDDVEPQLEVIEYVEQTHVVETLYKRDKKKKSKGTLQLSQSQEDGCMDTDSDDAPAEVSFKFSKNIDGLDLAEYGDIINTSETKKFKKNKKKKKDKDNELQQNSKKRKLDEEQYTSSEAIDNGKKRKISGNDDGNGSQGHSQKVKKRKHRDNDVDENIAKVSKQHSFDDLHVTRLPASLLEKLEDKPIEKKKLKVIATCPFEVQKVKSRKNKPSNYLERSVYLNDTPIKEKKKKIKTIPTVLPFIPTAKISGKGYTSNFNINVLPEDTTEFAAQATVTRNFKNNFLNKQRMKKMGTLVHCKMQRTHKLAKF